jgi:hypothetical protein
MSDEHASDDDNTRKWVRTQIRNRKDTWKESLSDVKSDLIREAYLNLN